MVVRTTIAMDAEVLAQVKDLAAHKNWSVSRAIAELVKVALHARPSGKRQAPSAWPTVRGRGVPAVDIADRVRLLDYLDEHDAEVGR